MSNPSQRFIAPDISDHLEASTDLADAPGGDSRPPGERRAPVLELPLKRRPVPAEGRAEFVERPDVVASAPPARSWVGEVTRIDHPSLRGRALVRVTHRDGESDERWLPTLQGLPVRPGDRVLLAQPENWPEALVTGVVDGFARRPRMEKRAGAQLALQADEVLRVVGWDGRELVEVEQGAGGPVVRLLGDDVDLELAGRLRIAAKSLELSAREGEARVEASCDVVIRGEGVRLN